MNSKQQGVECSMKYFVTGATGFIGGRVTRQLLAAGHEVVTLARTPSKAQELVALGVKVHAVCWLLGTSVRKKAP
jgi:uncharacterized protein YbjT (DUF2867 family)